jgi:polyisoprenyl-phosphate glycosyltransferase
MKHVLVIPVYNDWKSLNKLISKLNFIFKNSKKIKNEILIINDNSSEKIKINLKNLSSVKNIKIITLKENLGSQKAIAIGLDYLKKIKKKFFVTVMDGDGEDSPREVKRMLDVSIKNPNYIITSNRKSRQEPLIIVFCYKLHLIITFLFTLKWISFGNFSTFNKNNLDQLLKNSSSWYAHSSSVLKNCKIIRLHSKREKRYFDKSKLGLLALIEHSLRVNVVFYKNIFFTSSIYLLFLINFFENKISLIFIIMIIFFNVLIISIKAKHWIMNLSKISTFIKKINLIKTT